MRGFLIKWLVNIITLIVVINIVPGIHSDRLETTVVAALLLGLINAFLRPWVIAFTLPLTILTLGLFTLFVNGFMLYLVSKLVEGFAISNFWSAFWGALCFSVISFLLNIFISPQGGIQAYHYGYRSGSRSRSPHDHNVIDVEAKVEGTEDDK